MAVYPRFGRRSSYGIADEPYRHIQLFLEATSKIIGYCRKGTYGFGATHFPLSGFIVLQLIDRIQSWKLPSVSIISAPTGFHIKQADVRIFGLWDISFACWGLEHFKLHIRLSWTKPHFTCYYILKNAFFFTGSNLQSISFFGCKWC